MVDKPNRDQPETTPQEFAEVIKELAETPPVSNEEIVKRNKGKGAS